MKLGEFLRPSKGRIIASLALPYAWFGLGILYSLAQNIQFALIASSSVPIFIALTVISFLVSSIFYYPFVCSVSVLYTSRRKKQLKKITNDKMIFSVIVLSVIILNPITLNIISNLLYYSMLVSSINQLPYHECGILVKVVLPDSPASRAGIIPGTVIYKVNGTSVNITDLSNILKNSQAGQVLSLWVSYGNGTYGEADVRLGAAPSNSTINGTYLGIGSSDRLVKYDSQCSG